MKKHDLNNLPWYIPKWLREAIQERISPVFWKGKVPEIQLGDYRSSLESVAFYDDKHIILKFGTIQIKGRCIFQEITFENKILPIPCRSLDTNDTFTISLLGEIIVKYRDR